MAAPFHANLAILQAAATTAPSDSISQGKPRICQNLRLFGQCQNRDCIHEHPNSKSNAPPTNTDSMKKGFDAGIPSFTPSASLAPNGKTTPFKTPGLSPRAASAAPFKPKGLTPASSVASFSSSTAPKQFNPKATDWVSSASEPQEFVPQSHHIPNAEQSPENLHNEIYSSLNDSSDAGPLPALNTQHNHYHYETRANGNTRNTYLAGSTNTSQMLQHHFYAPPEYSGVILKPNERTAKDIFIPENLRIRGLKKLEATTRTFTNSQLPEVEHFHTLTPLEAMNHSNKVSNLSVSSVYKAISALDGGIYCLRRLHNCHLLKESASAQAVASLKTKWSQVKNPHIVTTHVAFSTQAFGDTSVIVVSKFLPCSITLRDRHPIAEPRSQNPNQHSPITEDLLWAYMVQAVSVLKDIHSLGSAVRMMEAKRWLVTDHNRIRYNACGLADILQPTAAPLQELQREDLHALGDLIFFLGTTNAPKRMRLADHFKTYSPRLNAIVKWLQSQTASTENPGTVNDLMKMIFEEVMDAYDGTTLLCDELRGHAERSFEHDRVARLSLKLMVILDRPEYETDPAWRDRGQRAALGLFRDYVFHQVDEKGRPVVDMGHMLACMNKLDVGTDEKITLITRDEETAIIVSFRELKGALDGAYGQLMRRSAGQPTHSDMM